MNMETKTIKEIREAEERIKRDPDFEASKIPDIAQKKDVGARLEELLVRYCNTIRWRWVV